MPILVGAVLNWWDAHLVGVHGSGRSYGGRFVSSGHPWGSECNGPDCTPRFVPRYEREGKGWLYAR